MDYEEKYKQALERASKLRVQNPFDTVGQMVEHIFPDLAESEGESVRNGIIALLKFGLEDGSAIAPGFNVTKEQAIAWLEKQCENKSDFSDLRVWKYIVDMVLTGKYGIGNYLDDPDTERIAKKLQEKYGNIEKQGQGSKKVSIWKHWENGICGNGEGKQIFLIKMGNTYNLSSCLGFECDYIELSELDNLMLEKQNKTLDSEKVIE